MVLLPPVALVLSIIGLVKDLAKGWAVAALIGSLATMAVLYA